MCGWLVVYSSHTISHIYTVGAPILFENYVRYQRIVAGDTNESACMRVCVRAMEKKLWKKKKILPNWSIINLQMNEKKKKKFDR